MGYTLGRAALTTCDLIVAQGADNEYAFRYGTQDDDGEFVPMNLTGWSARSQMRTKIGDAAAWLTLSSPGTIKLGADGYVTMHIPHSMTQGTPWNTRSSGVWDLELTNAFGVRIRLAEGAVTVDHDVTRDADGS